MKEYEVQVQRDGRYMPVPLAWKDDRRELPVYRTTRLSDAIDEYQRQTGRFHVTRLVEVVGNMERVVGGVEDDETR